MHSGQTAEPAEQATQHAICPQGKNTTVAACFTQTLHEREILMASSSFSKASAPESHDDAFDVLEYESALSLSL